MAEVESASRTSSHLGRFPQGGRQLVTFSRANTVLDVVLRES